MQIINRKFLAELYYKYFIMGRISMRQLNGVITFLAFIAFSICSDNLEISDKNSTKHKENPRLARAYKFIYDNIIEPIIYLPRDILILVGIFFGFVFLIFNFLFNIWCKSPKKR